MARRDHLTELVETAVTGLGYELVGVEFISQGKHSVLRVYIDTLEPELGVNLSDCEKVSHQLSGVLEVEDPIKGQYNLEISSPGLDRPLFTLEHFARFTGREAKLRLHHAIDGKRKFTASIDGVENDEILLSVEGEPLRITLDDVEKANLVPDFDKPGEK